MPYHKQIFRRINQDSDVRTMQPGDYRILRNGITVQATSTDALENAVTSIYGNALITNSALESNSKVVGFIEDRINKRAFFAVYNPNDNHTIYMVESDDTVTTVMRTDRFEFAEDEFVDMDIIGDMLVFTNNFSEIKKINITKAINGDYGTISTEKITLIKRPPQIPLVINRTQDGTFSNSYISDLFLLLTYRYIYEDNEESVFAPPTLVTFESIISPKNRVSYEIPTDEVLPTTVKQVDFAVMVNNNNELVVFKSIQVSNGTKPSVNYMYNVVGATEPDSKSTKWNDSVPIICRSLKIFKNRVFTFNNTESYNCSSQPITGFTLSLYNNGAGQIFKHRGSYQVAIMFFDNYGRIIGIRPSETGIITIPDRTNAPLGATDYNYIAYALPSGPQTTIIPSEATHFSIIRTKCMNISFFLTGRTCDIFYYKKASDGTLTYNKTYSANNTGCAIDISHLTNYNIGYTFNQGDRIVIYKSATPGDKKDFIIKSQDGRFLYVDNHNIGISTGSASIKHFEIYTPKEPSVAEPFYEAFSYDNPSLYSSYSLSADVPSYATRFAISNPGTGSRSFSKTSGYLIGDTVVESGGIYERTTDYSYSGTYSDTNPYSNTRSTISISPILLMNPFAKYYNVWNYGVGRRATTIPLVDSISVNKKNYIRFSQPYISGTSINGLNTFEALDEYRLPIENGAGVLLAEAGDILVGLHEAESTAIYVGRGFVNTADGGQFLAKTDNVIGDDRRYLGGNGTTHPKSVVSRDGRVYFYDSKKDCIVRRSQDGLTRISDYGISGIVSYIGDLHASDPDNSVILGGWDPQYNCYCISFNLGSGNYNFTFHFHEKTNSWVCISDLVPKDLFGILGQNQLAFKDGGLWKQTIEANYNNFFGVQYNRTLEWEISPLDSLMKIWEAIALDCENIYDTDNSNEEIVSMYLVKGGTKQTMINYLDFKQREGVWRSAFFRTINDINFGSAAESKYKSPYAIRSQSIYLKLVYNGTDRNILKSISTFFRPKMNSQT